MQDLSNIKSDISSNHSTTKDQILTPNRSLKHKRRIETTSGEAIDRSSELVLALDRALRSRIKLFHHRPQSRSNRLCDRITTLEAAVTGIDPIGSYRNRWLRLLRHRLTGAVTGFASAVHRVEWAGGRRDWDLSSDPKLFSDQGCIVVEPNPTRYLEKKRVVLTYQNNRRLRLHIKMINDIITLVPRVSFWRVRSPSPINILRFILLGPRDLTPGDRKEIERAGFLRSRWGRRLDFDFSSVNFIYLVFYLAI